MTWAHEDYHRPLKVTERRTEHAHHLKEKLLEEEGKRKKVEDQLETQGAELERARAELAAAQVEVARFKAGFSKYQEDTLMEVSRLQAWVEDAERKMVEATEEVVVARTVALSEYQSSAEFEQVCGENYDEGVWAFMYNVWREHPEWDLSFLGEVAREMIAEFNAPLETPLNDPPMEFVPPIDQSPQVANQPPQVINEDSHAVNAGSGGGADKDDGVV